MTSTSLHVLFNENANIEWLNNIKLKSEVLFQMLGYWSSSFIFVRKHFLLLWISVMKNNPYTLMYTD